MTVQRIPHRELRNSSAEILRRVADGEAFEVTNHGVVVAIISPPPAGRGGLPTDREATRRGGWSDLPRRSLPRSTAEVLDELREERL
ncbi:type II toxin-antitoxin system Phd/YefM family antitoxin [Nocardioides psychrotolerans]|uniref:type II toxin-antitoxin system Phd/YefM family antitoxin n=1 Tax=Nocardioides psychrotolerans TaxID=1005945 RepID=UPI000B82387B|nr:type II toxin-antitoxin system prevent-host-death family antitoxin [Nocardioides psychrotolerans]